MISISPSLRKRAAKALPITLSILSFGLSIYVYSSTLDATLEGNLRNQMLAYADKFEKVMLGSLEDPGTVEGYLRLTRQDQARVRIVIGLLAGVVDLMNEAKDPRATYWAKYLVGIPGPLVDDYPLEAWVRDPKTIIQIAEARRLAKDEFQRMSQPKP